MSETTRKCGDCALCCKLLKIPELQKPAQMWCQHCLDHKSCAVYSVRPPVCETFQCLWLEGLLPEEFHPGRVHFLAMPTKDGKNLQIHVDPNYEQILQRKSVQRFLDIVTHDGTIVIIAVGDRRTAYTPSGQIRWTSDEDPDDPDAPRIDAPGSEPDRQS